MDECESNPLHAVPGQEPLPARVIIIEDDERLRAYAARALAGVEDISLVGEAGTLAEGLPLVDLAPDLALLDLGLPDGSGISVIEAIRAKVPTCRVLVFTVFEDKASVIATLKAGADGYILKDTSAEMLLAHVRATIAGETPISARAASHLLSLVRSDPPGVDAVGADSAAADAPHLSPRERELLEYLARGEAVFEAIQAKLIRFERD